MTKKQTIIYPAPQPELHTAIAALQAAVDTVEHVKQTVREWPARIARAEAELADSERQLDRSETDRDLARGGKSGIEARIKDLAAEVAEKREALNRLRSRLPHLNARGEEANEGLESAKREVRTQQAIYFNALRDVIAAPYAESAADLAQYAAQYRALVKAAGYGLSTGGFDRACVPDIHDGSRDFLSVNDTGVVAAAVAAMNATLEPMRTAGPLLSAGRFISRRNAA